ncbi:hypothetical protein XocBAI20_13230, partial [Xanthomonas oryzae pv. oryzicola]
CMDASSFRTNSVSHLWCVVQRFPSGWCGLCALSACRGNFKVRTRADACWRDTHARQRQASCSLGSGA